MINPIIVERAIKNAIVEDNHYIDITTDLLIDPLKSAHAVMRAKQDGIICGLEVAMQCFRLFDKGCQFELAISEGDAVKNGQTIMRISGKARALLKAERIALNFIQRMSGIATMTKQYVDTLNNPKIKLVDTRKTTPNFRVFEKYAVSVGGAFNHRYNTSDCMMIKDNHIKVCGGIGQAVNQAKRKLGHAVRIEVEVANLIQLKEALAAKVDIIMLDNMSLDDMQQAAQIVNGKAILEVSGNVTLERLGELAKLPVDVISTGALTHSYSALDISLKVKL